MSKDVQLVRHKVGSQTFEIITKVFRNFSKAEKAKTNDLKEAYGTENAVDAAKIIAEKGDVQFTAAERKEFMEKKRGEIVNYLHKYYIDPRTKTPHPVARIEAALDELKIRVDPDMATDKQVAEIVKRLPEVLTIKKQEVEGTLTVPNKHMGVCAGILQKYVQVRNERYTEEGCVMAVAVVPGDYNALLAEMNKVTKGEFNFELDGAAAAATSEDDGNAGGKKGGGGKRGGGGGGRGARGKK